MLGGVVEHLYGGAAFLAIYGLSAVGGNIASYLFSAKAAVGASGAIFGLMGAVLVIAHGPLLTSR